MLTKDEIAYLETLPTDKIVHIHPYVPRLRELAEVLIAQVHEVHPEIEARFSGAAALGISGQNDLDLDFMASPQDFSTYLPTFITLFGAPREQKETVAVWTFYREDIEIDMWLSNPADTSSIIQWQLHCLLRDNPNLCVEYEKLKQQFDGKKYKDYQRAKYEFYHQVLPDQDRRA